MMDEVKQHTPIKSILLHLLPGVVVFISILIFSQPFFSELLGVDERLSPILGFLLGILFGLLPVQLGILLFAGKNETGKYTIRKTIKYTEKSQVKEYILFVPALILYFLVLFVAIAPIIQPYIVQTFFTGGLKNITFNCSCKTLQWWPAMME